MFGQPPPSKRAAHQPAYGPPAGPYGLNELKAILSNLSHQYLMERQPSKPPSIVRLLVCDDPHDPRCGITLVVGPHKYGVVRDVDKDAVLSMLGTLTYKVYALREDATAGGLARWWFLAREGFRVYGLDGSAIALEQARTRLTSEDLDAEYTHGDAMNMPFEADQFDAVIDIECLYANTKSDTLEIIDEIHRVLRPGGLLFSVTYMTGLPGDGERVEGEPNTYATLAAGPLHEGYGVVRMTGEEEISEIYGRFDSIAYDTLVRTDRDRTTEIREWLITATKGQDNER